MHNAFDPEMGVQLITSLKKLEADPNVRAVLITGDGDAFCAGYLAATLEGLDEHAALALGNACGASVAAAEGDLTGAPTRAEADRMTGGSAEQSIR